MNELVLLQDLGPVGLAGRDLIESFPPPHPRFPIRSRELLASRELVGALTYTMQVRTTSMRELSDLLRLAHRIRALIVIGPGAS